MEPGEFEGVIGRDFSQSRPWWPEPGRAAPGSPNVVVVILDDVGFAQLGCFGSDIATPVFDRLAAGGLRFTNFHTTALCSPTRACVLTGRNHHTNGMGRIVELATGFPGYDARIARANGMLPEMLVPAGYATFAVGKWHLTPEDECHLAAPRGRWPLGRGFERFYGFMEGETHQFFPALVSDNHQVPPPRRPEDGYHLTEDLVDRAIAFITDVRVADAQKPFFLYFCPGACHSPHQSPPQWIERYRGAFDGGWDLWREAHARPPAGAGRAAARDRAVAPARLGSGVGLAERRRAAPVRPLHGGLRRVPQPHRPPRGAAGGPPRDDGRARQHRPDPPVGQRRQLRRGPDGLGERRAALEPRPAHGEPRPWPASTRSAARGATTTTRGDGRWPATRRSSVGSARPTRAAWPTLSSSTGRQGIAARGETRRQYVHAIDIVPTVLEMLGVAAAARRGGRGAEPHRGHELRVVPRRRRRLGPSRHPVLRNVRLPGPLPRRLEGRHVPPDPGHAPGLRRGRVGALPRGPGRVGVPRPGRRSPRRSSRT